MKNKIGFYIGIFFFILFLFSCNSKSNELEEYIIISEIINHSYGKKSDDENRLGWIDSTKTYNSLLVLDHTNLREFDLETLNQYLIFNNLKDFSIEDFKVKKKWDMTKIKEFNRYKLEVMNGQSIKSPYIGMIQISSISFNKEINKAIVYTSFLCSGNADCGEGLVYHLKKGNKWEVKKVESLWES
ncbi:hypothetical protein [Aquimarina sp. 2201CG5-10]|uniref:hypothetical protein n=1 Tax=Aquimarina callyspongiae TaxID=3098150 RepID=UPI002AB5AA3E|nr:hypothetical protein [Aquimarina sp. 2201CG5-10]MDY8137502.1 hypothetical protein [Aquimarina sp. 2201CG5-10]